MKNRLFYLGALATLIMATTACPDDKPAGPRPDDKPATPAAAEWQAAVKGANGFAARLYGQLSADKSNLCFSPHGIASVLSLTYAGVRGETAEQMAKALQFLNQSDQHAAFAELIRELNNHGITRDYQLQVVNGLWEQQGEPTLDSFSKIARNDYGVRPRHVDFQLADEARVTINRWISEHTNHRVQELLSAGSITPQTALVVTNTVYFQAAWQRPFDAKKAETGDFLVETGQKTPVTFMNQTGNFNYFDGNFFQALEIPYEGNDLAMVVLLPRKSQSLSELEKAIAAGNLAEVLPRLKTHEIELSLPKFKFSADLRLKEQLVALGMPLAFGNADLSGINGKNNLALSDVVHSAFIDVN